MMIKTTKYILIFGNPVDGFSYWGPYDTFEEALEKAENALEGDWWVSELIRYDD